MQNSCRVNLAKILSNTNFSSCQQSWGEFNIPAKILPRFCSQWVHQGYNCCSSFIPVENPTKNRGKIPDRIWDYGHWEFHSCWESHGESYQNSGEDPALIMATETFIPNKIPGRFLPNAGGHNRGRTPVLFFFHTKVAALRNLPSKLKCLRTPWIIVS